MKGSRGEAAKDWVIDVRGLSVERDRPILREVNWRVRRGEHWAVMGANGSGKTALLRSVTGYMTASSGEVLVAGGDADEPWESLRQRVGFVSSNLGQRIEEDEPVLETVISGRYSMINYWARRVRREDREMAREILERVECSHLEKMPWGVLSQGERQRVLIGRALMLEELQLLLLDEPCAGLDPVARERFLRFVERLGEGSRDEGPTVVLITHHIEEIIPLFSHVLLLREGRVVEQGEAGACLRSGVLSEVFDARVSVRRRSGRYVLEVEGEDGDAWD
ncbi:MAG: ATP-binding cassette domain-containing protein [Verrucomicrobiota bacterium]